MAKAIKTKNQLAVPNKSYLDLVAGIADLLAEARHASARAVNAILTASYWETGRRIVEFEQGGETRAEYGEAVLQRLANDLTARCGRGFSKSNLFLMRAFYLGWQIFQTPSGKFGSRSSKAASDQPITAALPADAKALAATFPLSWSHYVRLLSVGDLHARSFYETEAMRGNWSVRQLDRQIGSQFYERTALSKNKAAMLHKGQQPKSEDLITVRQEIRDPYLLEFLDLKDEYSETDLEDALIHHLEWFLLELGAGFTFVARQKRIRIGHTWYRIDLLLFHRGLRCLVVIDLKTGSFTHADAGQMNLYLNYAKEHLKMAGEADPVGLILCSDKNDAVVKYATGGINTQVFASQYLVKLPDESLILAELERTRKLLDQHLSLPSPAKDQQP